MVIVTCVVGLSVSPTEVAVDVRDLDSGKLIDAVEFPVVGALGLEPGEFPVENVLPAFEEALAATAAHQPEAIGLAGPLHALVVMDEVGAVIRPVMLAEDRRSGPDAGWCTKKIAPSNWAALVGSVPRAAFTVTKLSWLHRSEAAVWGRAKRFMSLHGYLRGRLCLGEVGFVTDRGTASGTGYWSALNSRYDDTILQLIDAERSWTDALPTVIDAMVPAGGRGASSIAVGTADLMAASLALDLCSGDVLVSVGGITRVSGVSDQPVLDETGAVLCFAAAGAGYLPTVEVPEPQASADMARGVRSAVEELGAAGVAVSGRLIVRGAGAAVPAVAAACAELGFGSVEHCGGPEVVAAGASVHAAACATGLWPGWRAVNAIAV